MCRVKCSLGELGQYFTNHNTEPQPCTVKKPINAPRIADKIRERAYEPSSQVQERSNSVPYDTSEFPPQKTITLQKVMTPFKKKNMCVFF